jgi:hypothetical protein
MVPVRSRFDQRKVMNGGKEAPTVGTCADAGEV